MAQKRIRPQVPNARRMPRFRSDTSYMMRGVVDVGKMAMFGAVTAGTIGVVGSMIPKN